MTVRTDRKRLGLVASLEPASKSSVSGKHDRIAVVIVRFKVVGEIVCAEKKMVRKIIIFVGVQGPDD